jgi:hypothetical protein
MVTPLKAGGAAESLALKLKFAGRPKSWLRAGSQHSFTHIGEPLLGL